MSGPVQLRLARLRIDGYGRLQDVEFAPAARPGTIVLAPNEAGKSTLVSALYRGLFGFEERSAEEERRPWEGGPFRVALEWNLGDQWCAIGRDFDDQRVTVEWRRGSRQGPIERRWEGAPNPRGRSADRAAYEAELERLLGFSSPQIFRQTAFIGPGDPGRPLASELLRLLSGSERADFRAALDALEAGWYGLTRADIGDPSRNAKRDPRALEANAEDRRDLAARAEAARSGHAARRAAERACLDVRARLAAVEREIAARRPVGEAIRRRAGIRREVADAERRLAQVKADEERFAQWAADFREREAVLRPLVPYLHRPREFHDRMLDLARLNDELVAVLEGRGRSASEGRPPGRGSSLVIALSGVLSLIAAAVGWTIDPSRPLLLAALGLAGAGLAGWGAWRLRGRSRRLAALEAESARLELEADRLQGRRREIAEAYGLDLGNVDPIAESERVLEARELSARLDGMSSARERLGDRAALEAERKRLEREVLDVLRLEDRQILAAHPYLDSDPDSERRHFDADGRLEAERKRLEQEDLDRRRELADLPAGRDDPRRLEADVERLLEESEELAIERDAHRLAWTTLTSCKHEFVQVMADRIERRVGRILSELTEARYAEVHIDPASLDLTVSGVERMNVSAGSLSRGARDQLYFALRVALLEVLAPERCLPLVLDDPFLNFDGERLARTQRMLARLGESHQVLLFSHDPRLAAWSFPRAGLLQTADAASGGPSRD